jgi:hypothetical protein
MSKNKKIKIQSLTDDEKSKIRSYLYRIKREQLKYALRNQQKV